MQFLIKKTLIFQATLDTFFLSGGSSSKTDHVLLTSSMTSLSTFSCPICRNNIRASTENAFNSHLDNCLEKAETKDKCENDQCKVTKSPNLVALNQSENPEHSKLETDSMKDTKLEKIEASSSTFLPLDRSNKSCQIYNCPICECQVKASNLPQFNQHLDKCLEQSDKEIVAKKQDKNFFGNCQIQNSIDSDLHDHESDQELSPVLESNFFGHNIEKERASHNENKNFFGKSLPKPIAESNFFGRSVEKEKRKNSSPNEEVNFFEKSLPKTDEKSVSENHSESESYPSCPICGLCFSQVSINSHIDECLNNETIQSLRHDQSAEDRAKKRKIEPKCSKAENKRSKSQKGANSKSILNYFQSKGP